ncbi:MAG: hypothetical protein QOK28_2108 [Actinomycetota bacterium]
MTPPRIASSIGELVAGATDRVAINPEDGKSGNSYELLTIDGARYFLKILSYDADWIMRCTGNTEHWEYKVWEAGLYDRCPIEIDHAMVGMALEGDLQAQLMRDISASLVPEGDAPVTLEQHDAFMDHMAAFHVAYWGFEDTVGLSTLEQRMTSFSDENIAREIQAADPPAPIRVGREGWALLPERAPRLAAAVRVARENPSSVADRMRTTPQTFIMGDWKMGNLGYHADTRQTVLVDWAYPGAAPGTWDLMWYLALNRARLPRTKEESIAAYREGLDRRGIDTAPWWDEQLHLGALGVMAMIGWEKAVGDADELAWWDEFVTATSGGAGKTRR